MIRWSAIGLIALGIVHMVVLGSDAVPELPKWLGLNLWTFEHWQPLHSQPHDLALSNGVFWSTVGSFAIPLMILGGLILWLDRRGQAIPAFVGWALVAWVLFATLIMLPSGFPVGLVIAACLVIAIQRQAKA